MKHYIFLTNIPTPYRTDFYNTLKSYGLYFTVFYMRNTEKDRNWVIDEGMLDHNYIIDRGFYRMMGRFHVHFNPRLLSKIISSRSSEVIVGGAWNDLDVLLLALLCRIGVAKNRLHFWSEANYLTNGASNDNWLKRFTRRFVYHSSDGVQILSGKMTEITLKCWKIRANGFVTLPNTIEEARFRIERSDQEKRKLNILPHFLMPVRLVESDKGIINFFNAIGRDRIEKAVFCIAGEGRDRKLIERFIEENGYELNIRLMGHCDTSTMVKLYISSNVFLLPSFSDPSPLSLVEAICMRLPVLVSNRCGNHFEAVHSGENGELFDPYTPESVTMAFDRMLERRGSWSQMGDYSAKLYTDNFSKEKVLKRFITELSSFKTVRSKA